MFCQQEQRAKIEVFDKEFHFLSNFHYSPLVYDNLTWSTAEHAYQAAKTNNVTQKSAIYRIDRPGDAKKMGKVVTVREDWEEVKLGIMYDIVKAKFDQNPDLREMLLATEDAEIVEGNWWGDTFWGVCKGVGENHLGKILMRVREESK
jgi:N-glycosidase YbiA